MRKPKIVVIGSVNADMIIKAATLPAPGETVTGGSFVMAAGGKGANQAVAAARLGADVTLVARIGTDVFGDEAIENYRTEGISTHLILRDAHLATGVALILVDGEGENLISVASGANHALTPEDLAHATEAIRSADAVLLQLEIPMETVKRAVDIAHDAGVAIVLDPAPASPLDNELLARVTYLTPNETEASRLTGIDVRDEATARQAADRLRAAGAQHVIVTLGAAGALVSSTEESAFIHGHSVEAVDSTAAGDSFNGGLATALASGKSLREAVKEACIVGALSVTRMGAQPSLPTASELQAVLSAR